MVRSSIFLALYKYDVKPNMPHNVYQTNVVLQTEVFTAHFFKHLFLIITQNKRYHCNKHAVL